jgi:hypothetical protein
MTYFKYSFLNSLRDELGLTMTRQKLTFFHFLYLAIPLAGIGAGSSLFAHSPLKATIGGVIGFIFGSIIAWQLPRSLWNMLRLFARKGWLLRLENPKSLSAITKDEFIAKSNVLRQKGKQHFFIWALIFVVGAFGCSRLAFYMDKAKPEIWIQILAFVGILAFIGGYLFLRRRLWKKLIKELNLVCPNCGMEITDAPGLSRMPHMGICRHCGTKAVEI